MRFSPVLRYLENTLGLTRVGRDFFAAEACVDSGQRRCYLVHAEVLERPSLVEMAERLKQAVEMEFSKRGLAQSIEVCWWSLQQEAGLPEGNVSLCLEFGSDFRERSTEMKPYGVVRLPRLQEIHDNPVAKREAWKQIQAGIAELASSTLV